MVWLKLFTRFLKPRKLSIHPLWEATISSPWALFFLHLGSFLWWQSRPTKFSSSEFPFASLTSRFSTISLPRSLLAFSTILSFLSALQPLTPLNSPSSETRNLFVTCGRTLQQSLLQLSHVISTFASLLRAWLLERISLSTSSCCSTCVIDGSYPHQRTRWRQQWLSPRTYCWHSLTHVIKVWSNQPPRPAVPNEISSSALLLWLS